MTDPGIRLWQTELDQVGPVLPAAASCFLSLVPSPGSKPGPTGQGQSLKDGPFRFWRVWLYSSKPSIPTWVWSTRVWWPATPFLTFNPAESPLTYCKLSGSDWTLCMVRRTSCSRFIGLEPVLMDAGPEDLWTEPRSSTEHQLYTRPVWSGLAVRPGLLLFFGPNRND